MDDRRFKDGPSIGRFAGRIGEWYAFMFLSSWVRVIIFIVPLIGGAWLAAYQAQQLAEYSRIARWPSVSGIVTESGLVGERAIRPALVYQYVVDSITYSGQTTLQAPMFGGKRKKYDVAHTLVEKYPVGAAVEVYYNPDSVAQSTLITSSPWSVYGQLAVGVTLMLIGAAGLVFRPGAGRPRSARWKRNRPE